MRLVFASLILVAMAMMTSPVVAQTEATSRSQQLDEMIERYHSSMKAYRLLPANERGMPPWKTFPSTFLKFAQAIPDDASLRACEFIILTFYIADERYAAINLVTRQHLDKPLVGRFLGNLVHSYDSDPVVDECLKKAAAASSKSTQELAAYQQTRLMIERRNWCLDGDIERYQDAFSKQQIAAWFDEHARKRIAEQLQLLIATDSRASYLGKPLLVWARQDLFEIQNLEIGCPVPMVEGRDSNGKTFQISEFRGRVVVITFWAGWCGPCMADLPHEMRLVEAMKGRPLTWIGVNGDADIQQLQKLEAKHHINFRSWHDGEDGPIARQFVVRGWPALYVVDQDGVIRYKSRVSVELDQAKKAIESLVESLERRNASSK